MKERTSPIVDITLGQILGFKQTGIGKAGLVAFIRIFGILAIITDRAVNHELLLMVL